MTRQGPHRRDIAQRHPHGDEHRDQRHRGRAAHPIGDGQGNVGIEAKGGLHAAGHATSVGLARPEGQIRQADADEQHGRSRDDEVPRVAQTGMAAAGGGKQQSRKQHEIHQPFHPVPHAAVERGEAHEQQPQHDQDEVRQQEQGVVQHGVRSEAARVRQPTMAGAAPIFKAASRVLRRGRRIRLRLRWGGAAPAPCRCACRPYRRSRKSSRPTARCRQWPAAVRAVA